MPKEESLDGPRIAAEILKRLPNRTKDRLVKAIQDISPAVASRVEENLFNFDDILDITPQGVQVLIQEVEHRDLVLSFKTASAEVKTFMLNNMTERKQRLVHDDFQALPPLRTFEVEAAQRRILTRLEELRAAGLIRTRSKNDIWV